MKIDTIVSMFSPVPYTDFGVVIKCVCVGRFYFMETETEWHS